MLSHLCVDQPSPCSKGAGPLGWVNAGGQHSKLPGIVVTPFFQPYVTASVASADAYYKTMYVTASVASADAYYKTMSQAYLTYSILTRIPGHMAIAGLQYSS